MFDLSTSTITISLFMFFIYTTKYVGAMLAQDSFKQKNLVLAFFQLGLKVNMSFVRAIVMRRYATAGIIDFVVAYLILVYGLLGIFWGVYPGAFFALDPGWFLSNLILWGFVLLYIFNTTQIKNFSLEFYRLKISLNYLLLFVIIHTPRIFPILSPYQNDITIFIHMILGIKLVQNLNPDKFKFVLSEFAQTIFEIWIIGSLYAVILYFMNHLTSINLSEHPYIVGVITVLSIFIQKISAKQFMREKEEIQHQRNVNIDVALVVAVIMIRMFLWL